MKLYFMKQKALEALQKDISENMDKYQISLTWIDQYFIEKEASMYYFDTGIEVEDYQLINGGAETDFQNAKIIYEAFKDKINPVQASDLRLWAYLAHSQHWDYMFTRWNITVPDAEDEPDDGKKTPFEKAMDRVKSRYFFGASRGKAFVRQGIARLYWSAYLTYDVENENPYEYTEFFFSKQDIFSSITERSYARNKILVLTVLKELKKHPDMSRDDIRLFLAKLNQAGAITVLDYLDEEETKELCENIMKEVMNVAYVEEGSTFTLYHNVTGKAYGAQIRIIGGKATLLGKPISVKPPKLIGKREGAKVSLGGSTYIIKDIK